MKTTNESNSVYGYICGSDSTDVWIGADDVRIFSSVEALKEARTCWEECGIVRISLKGEVVVEGTLHR